MASSNKWYGDRAEKKVMSVVEKGIRDMAADAVKQAQVNANQAPPKHPQVQTGTMRRSITLDVESTRDKVIAKVGIMKGKGEGDKALEYAPGIEFGTERHPPYPFLFPAVKEITDNAKRYF